MSVQCLVICLDCREAAPPVGDGGFVGAPSLGLDECPDYKEWGTLPSFGFLYDALKAVHIRTFELDLFGEWLTRHAGHRLTMHADSELPSPELEALFDEWSSVDSKRQMAAAMKQREDDATRAQAEGHYVMAIYEATCARCGEAIASPEPELLRRIEPTTLSAADADLYLYRWGPALEDRVVTWQLMSPIVDPEEPFAPELRQFLERHREHDISVSLSVDGA